MYCKHGTNIGNPYGADLMCGFCEDGTTETEFELMKENEGEEILSVKEAKAYYDQLEKSR